ncbi:MFS transporter [Rubrobacter marinus]|uniref:MFS transporter n=1 Tax=Rubrobacter marinus TaxID=2653852 RepID=A0A6G8Q383_9ACTN|nr:MFS transporter [Rubrobacter marinus]
MWAASTISNLGDGITLVAGPLLAATLTRDPVLVAGLLFAQQLPWLLFSLPSGALVDRLDRRLTMGAVDLFRCVILGILGLAVMADWATLPLLYAVFFLLGTSETLFANASLAIMPSVVAKDQLEKANGRLFAAELVTNQFAGGPIGGALFAVAAALPFLLDAGTFAASAALVLALRGRFRVSEDGGARGTSLWSEIAEGVGWLTRHRLLLALALMLGAGNLVFSATFSVLVLYAQDVLGLGGVGYGLLLTAGGVGGFLGSLLAGRIGALLGTGRALFAVMFVQGPAFAGVALSGNPFVVGAMIAVDGFAAFSWNVLTFALRQTLIPDRLLGRVTSVYRLIGVGSGAFGALIGGLLARSFGLSAPFWFAAGVMLVVSLASLPFVNNRTVAKARDAAQ